MQDLVVSRTGRLGRIHLNRPKSLNSLTLQMVRDFARALDEFGANGNISAVLVTGEGERAFCAGGDIRALYDLPATERGIFKVFWREEYELDARVASFPKPYVVIMDGVVMGGGVGISAHGNRRVVTERTRLAMPEVGIGFIPDVGGTWLLSRAKEIGIYMGLSGAALTAADAIDANMADLLVRGEDIPRLIEDICNIQSAGDVDALLRRFAQDKGDGHLAQWRPLLASTMRYDEIARIIAALAKEPSDFANRLAVEIGSKSPTSLKVTHALLKRAAAADDLKTCLINEYRAASQMLLSHDLYEGIRAAVVDKDRRPQWSPETLEEVSGAMVEAILAGDGSPPPSFTSWPAAPYPRWERKIGVIRIGAS